jgi:hypothetical protein
MTRASLGASILLAAAMPLASCGYAPVYPAGGAGRLHVKLVRSLIADPVAADEVAQGVREELARQGCLEQGEGFPRVEIEVVAEGESGAGLIAGGPGALAPSARATAVSIVGRGWVAAEAGAPAQRDSGDLRAEASFAVDENTAGLDPRASTFHSADALRSAARRLGSKIGRRVLGMPSASEDASEGP